MHQSKNISDELEAQYIKPYSIHQPCETALGMVLRAAQLHNESAMEMRRREILFKIGSEGQAALRHQRGHVLAEQNHLVLEGDARR